MPQVWRNKSRLLDLSNFPTFLRWFLRLLVFLRFFIHFQNNLNIFLQDFFLFLRFLRNFLDFRGYFSVELSGNSFCNLTISAASFSNSSLILGSFGLLRKYSKNLAFNSLVRSSKSWELAEQIRQKVAKIDKMRRCFIVESLDATERLLILWLKVPNLANFTHLTIMVPTKFRDILSRFHTFMQF